MKNTLKRNIAYFDNLSQQKRKQEQLFMEQEELSDEV